MHISNIGSVCLWSALLLSLLPLIMPFFRRLSKPISLYVFLLSLGSFLSLAYAYITSDFSVLNVALNSHTLKPLIYKITGVWGNHEGSMLLWVLVLSVFGVAMGYSRRFDNNEKLREKVLVIHGLMVSLFLCFIIFTSDPFIRIDPPPSDGKGLNPLLQDIGLAFHPPLLYGGYVGFSAVFSIACAALLQGKIDKELGSILRFWTLLAWTLLTAGIGLGMWWAYYELGWGGFWFWDPVENASLMPWLAGTALLHSAIMLQKRELLKGWTMVLAILTFGFSLMGTFIVRSGIIASVHSFASSPERGIFILIILLGMVSAAFILLALRKDKLKTIYDHDFLSREMGLILNNYLLAGILLIVFIGTLYPTFLEVITGDRISVGAPYFNISTWPFAILIAILCPIAGFMGWSKTNWIYLKKPLICLLFFTFGCGVTLYFFQNTPLKVTILISLGIWLIFGTITDVWIKSKRVKLSLIYRDDIAKISSHIAIGMLLIGIAGAGILKTEETLLLKKGDRTEIAGEIFFLKTQKVVFKDNYLSDQVLIQNEEGREFMPERRFFPVAEKTTTEADISLEMFKDIYITIGTIDDDGNRLVNIRIHPMVGLLWLSIILAALGGVTKLFILFRRNY